MGKWGDEAVLQIGQFQRERMNMRNALELIAYWAQERGKRSSAQDWVPLVAKIARDAEPASFTAFQKLVKAKAPLPIPFLADFTQGIVESIFDVAPNEPAVNRDIKAEVFDFIEKSAKILDKKAPDRRVPRFIKKELTKKGQELLKSTIKIVAKKKTSGVGMGALLLLLLIVTDQ